MGRVENIVGEGENADYLHFLLFPQCFQKASFSRLLKVGIVWERLKKDTLWKHPTDRETRAPHAGGNAWVWGAW